MNTQKIKLKNFCNTNTNIEFYFNKKFEVAAQIMNK